MAVTVVASVLNDPKGADNSQRRTFVQGTFTLSGAYVAGGFVFPWLTLVDASGQAVLLPTPETNPIWVEVQQSIPAAAGPAYLFLVQWNYSTNLFQIFGSPATSAEGTGFEEISAATLPTGVSSATFAFKAEFLFSA